MAHLAIIVNNVLAIIATCSNKKVHEKLNFSGCRVAFCLVRQFTAYALGCRKSAMVHSNRPLIFAPIVFLFLLRI